MCKFIFALFRFRFKCRRIRAHTHAHTISALVPLVRIRQQPIHAHSTPEIALLIFFLFQLFYIGYERSTNMVCAVLCALPFIDFHMSRAGGSFFRHRNPAYDGVRNSIQLRHTHTLYTATQRLCVYVWVCTAAHAWNKVVAYEAHTYSSKKHKHS